MTPDAAVPTTAAHPILALAESEGRSILLEHEVYVLLGAAGIAVPAHRRVAGPDGVDADLCAALESAEAVVKVVSPQILHKSDAGGVLVVRNEPAAVRDAVASVLSASTTAAPAADVRGALVARKIPFRAGLGREILAGFRHDRAFGPVVFAGVGGLDTEYLLRSLAAGTASGMRSTLDLDLDEALRMVRGTVVHAALCGGLRSAKRGAVAETALARLVLSLGALADILGGFDPPGGLGLTELEVNPFVASDEDGRLVALDGLARLHRPAPLPAPRPVSNLRKLLTPGSAVVIGASADSVNPGRIILRNLVEGGGVPQDRIWPIHPHAETIEGCRAYSSPASLPAIPDMAVVSVPADKGADRIVVDLVDNHRAHTVTLISGGFAETEGGKDAEARMRDAVERSHLRPDGGVLVNGGNCLGIISVPGGYNTFFIPPHKLPIHDAPGTNVACISQSGAHLVTQMSNLDRTIRARYLISFGNQIDVTVSDYLEYLEGDPAIQVFVVYLEGFRRGDGLRFLAVARRIVAGGRKVLLYKGGRTREGQAAAASHTASVVGDYDVCREIVRSAGVDECPTLDLFDDYTMTFSFLAGRKRRGKRVAVMSNAGFECTAAADKLYGMTLARFSPETERRLRGLLPGIVDVHNPIDATPVCRTEPYVGCVEAIAEDPYVDALVVAGVPNTPALEDLAAGEGHGEDISRPRSLPSRLIEVFLRSPKPMTFSVDAGTLYEPFVAMMRSAGLPCFRKVDRATRALAAFLGTI
ncbi:MAG: acetate--CoA ligase family protein [Acidobacteriia bacterium]|nr:acetate--CoA ligase family protein [Terriglobia bacterium]